MPTPLERSRYWTDPAHAAHRAALEAQLAELKVGQRLRIADAVRAISPAAAEAAERAENPMVLVDYTTGFIRAAEIDEDTREVDLAFSSEEPYQRWWGIEILGHSTGEVDMSWVASGRAPLLADHDRWTQIGVVRSAWLGSDRKGRARVRFGRSERAEQEMQDAKDDVRINVSVGYEINELELVKQEGEVKTYRVTDWKPLEVSLVAIPADMTVGLGRTAQDNAPPKPTTKESTTMPNPAATLDPAEKDRLVAEARAAAQKEEQDRVKGIMALATSHNLRELAERAVHDGTSLATFRGLALDELHKRGSDKPLYQPTGQIGLSGKEAKSFSVAKYMRSLLDKNPDVAPFETECAKAVREAMDKAGHRASNGGHFLPHEVLQQPLPGVRVVEGHLMIGDRVIAGAQRDLATSSTGAGGAMVATDLLATDFITFLRNITMVRRMGARMLSGLVGNVNIPRQTGTTTMNWLAQAGGATESDATFAVVSLSMKTAHGMQDVTRDLLVQGTPAVEGLVRADLLESMAVAIDLAALHGTGSGNQPTGLAATAGIGAEVGGANGAAPTWDNIVGLESAVANNNAAFGSVGYLTNTRVRGKLKRTQKFSGTNGQEIWLPPMGGDDASVMGQLNGYRAGVSNNVRSDLTKGTSNGVCSAIFFGNWSDLLIGEWGTPELLPDPLTQAANRIVRFHIYQSVDVAVRRAQSFSAMLDALHA